MNSKGAGGGVLVFWDKRIWCCLELVGMNVGKFSISCCFKSMRTVLFGFYKGCMDPL